MVTPGVLTQHRIVRIPEENTKSRIPKESKPAAIQGPPSPDAEREARNSQSQKARGCFDLGPRVHIFHQTVSRVPAANRAFLGPWMADIRQKCHSLTSPRGDTQHPWALLLQHTQETELPGPGG